MGEHDLGAIAGRVQASFAERHSLLTFPEFLDLFREHPYRFARCAAQYMVDAMDADGQTPVEHFGRPLQRFQLFDRTRPDGAGRVAGQEEAAAEVYRLLYNFARQGYADRLILLYGPNGSAKTSLVDALFRCLEAYSQTPDGALYGFFGWLSLALATVAMVAGGGVFFRGAVAGLRRRVLHLDVLLPVCLSAWCDAG